MSKSNHFLSGRLIIFVLLAAAYLTGVYLFLSSRGFILRLGRTDYLVPFMVVSLLNAAALVGVGWRWASCRSERTGDERQKQVLSFVPTAKSNQ